MSDYVRALGVKLRSIRQQQGLSLPGVEHKSGGQWKATAGRQRTAPPQR